MRYNRALARRNKDVQIVDASVQRHRRVMVDGLNRQIALARHLQSGNQSPFKYTLRGEEHTPAQWWRDSDDGYYQLVIRYGRVVIDEGAVLRVRKDGLIRLLEKILADVQAGLLDKDLQAFARARGLNKPKPRSAARRLPKSRSRI